MTSKTHVVLGQLRGTGNTVDTFDDFGRKMTKGTPAITKLPTVFIRSLLLCLIVIVLLLVMFQKVPTFYKRDGIRFLSISTTLKNTPTSHHEIPTRNIATQPMTEEQNNSPDVKVSNNTVTVIDSSQNLNTQSAKILNRILQDDLALSADHTDKNNERIKQYVYSHQQILIIVAYKRTGSTLTASLFQEYPGTFYVFEPIRFLHQTFEKLRITNSYFNLNYIHGRTRNVSATEEDKVEEGEINSWLTCKLDLINLNSLTDGFHEVYTQIMKQFYYCAKSTTSIKTNAYSRFQRYLDQDTNIDACLKFATSSCQKAPLIVLKFIRLKMEVIEKLLPFYPNMKVIHLVRDPRGILNSRLHLNAMSTREYEKNVDELCMNLSENLRHSKTILEQYPNKLKIVYYEDMAAQPNETAREIVEFTGLPYMKHMQMFIQSQTNSSRDTCAYCTQRKDSNGTANKWRNELPFSLSSYTFNACRISNNILGYMPFSSSLSQNDLSNPSRSKVDTTETLLSHLNFDSPVRS